MNKVKSFFSILILITSITSIAKTDELKLVGKAMAEFSIFKIDIYEISYLKNETDTDELVLDYKRDIKAKYSIMGWEEGLKHLFKSDPIYEEKFKWIKQQVVNLKKGDKYVIRREGNKVTILKNGNKISSIKDDLIAMMVIEPWIGKKPIDLKIKKKLLGLTTY